jgi:hypothetical protein
MNFHKLTPVKFQLARLQAAGVPHSSGIFLLYKANMGPPHWVGRADRDLYETLTAHKGKGIYPYFKFMACKSPDDAYQWECIYWHQGSATLDNGEAKGGHHPHLPKGSTTTCPVPGCSYVHTHSTPALEEMETERENMDGVQ